MKLRSVFWLEVLGGCTLIREVSPEGLSGFYFRGASIPRFRYYHWMPNAPYTVLQPFMCNPFSAPHLAHLLVSDFSSGFCTTDIFCSVSFLVTLAPLADGSESQ